MDLSLVKALDKYNENSEVNILNAMGKPVAFKYADFKNNVLKFLRAYPRLSVHTNVTPEQLSYITSLSATDLNSLIRKGFKTATKKAKVAVEK